MMWWSEFKHSIQDTPTRGIKALRETYPKLKIAPGLVIAPVEGMGRLSETEYCLPWDSQ